ncbi:glutaredoxin [Xylariaceae sp. FL0662B]|nr:glutaredoxin [Xylariaceae sp. FL0662B]
MPSPRRLRVLLMIALGAVITTLFFTSHMRSTGPHDTRTVQDFFGKTVNGLNQKGQGQVVMSGKGQAPDVKDKDGDGTIDEDDKKLAQEMSERLRAAEQKAKDLANAKAPLKPDAPSDVVGVGSAAGGQKKAKPKAGSKLSEDEEEESEQEHEVEVTLNQILKRAPVVIFSKTYCPYSKKAKGTLLEKYSIDPAPYVVELDKHPLGKELQASLAEKTGRRTVPNILINGKSIGGSDEIAELDSRKTLIDKIKSMGGKRISMKERFIGSVKDRE